MRRYKSYASALDTLRQAPQQDLTNDFVMSGIVDKFRLQFELGWKLMKKLLEYEGESVASSGSPRDILKTSFQTFGFLDEGAWLSMLRDRNTSTHIYDGLAARELATRIIGDYIPEFEHLRSGLVTRYGEEFLMLPDDEIDRRL